MLWTIRQVWANAGDCASGAAGFVLPVVAAAADKNAGVVAEPGGGSVQSVGLVLIGGAGVAYLLDLDFVDAKSAVHLPGGHEAVAVSYWRLRY
ncbi:hypothetical protein [Microbulbifer taiwanensis]|uniref:Uncharacterized protein n=1 Tax=Microbulbifer taiwanensis TaxID=986746 RepID=A0ABW1YWC0_9GAMM|nr:hypothetical protein [Microbulbifer taiwanensis]